MAGPGEGDRERLEADRGGLGGDILHRRLVDLADEAERDMQILRRHPARAVDAAGERPDAQAELVGQLQAEEQADHRSRVAAAPRGSA